MKIATVIGNRPQFIKAAAVSRAIKKHQNLQEIIIHTGQHYDKNMSDNFFADLEIPQPSYNLNINQGSHGQQTGKMIIELEQVLQEIKPEYILLYGDTNSTIAGAIAAAKLSIKIVHIEAGLRSYNKTMPEEINRIVTDCVSDILFPPTQNAYTILSNEGVDPQKIHMVGDVMYDAALFYAQQVDSKSDILNTLKLEQNNYFLSTIHRAYNTDCKERLSNIVRFLSEMNKTCKVVLPLHPRTKNALVKFDLYEQLKKTILLIDPIGFFDILNLEMHCKAVITDSGGVQKEAFFHQKPCITLRDETEWSELVECGCNLLLSPETLESKTSEALAFVQKDLLKSFANKLYGNGDAADKIAAVLAA